MPTDKNTVIRVSNGRTTVVFDLANGKTLEACIEGGTVVLTAGTSTPEMNPVVRVNQLTPARLIVTPNRVPVRHLD
ncbi:MAG TPA: hypothetical protein VJJ02_05160 [Candidatus Paceibacterota bacterium]